jgi:hypothetical protein
MMLTRMNRHRESAEICSRDIYDQAVMHSVRVSDGLDGLMDCTGTRGTDQRWWDDARLFAASFSHWQPQALQVACST